VVKERNRFIMVRTKCVAMVASMISFYLSNPLMHISGTEGNVYFRDLVCNLIEPFVSGATATQRTNAIQDAVDHIHSLGGRFLRRHQINGTVC
jgi:hypothetical protein